MKLTDLKDKKIAIWGKGQEGNATAKFLSVKYQISNISFFDDYDETCQKPTFENLIKFDYIIKSPGISPYRPVYQEAKKAGSQFLSATGLWFRLNKPGTKICISGTKGKSTTSSLLAFVLDKLGYKTLLCGNIGIPLTSDNAINGDYDYYVIELSSYQIKSLEEEKLEVGDIRLLLNLYPEHLDWHLTTENYFEDKISFLKGSGINIINKNDVITNQYLSKIPNHKFFNDKNYQLINGEIYLENSMFYSTENFPLKGDHYLLDLVAVFEVLHNLGIDFKSVLKSLAEFKPLPHRMNILGNKEGITYINDSISTIPETSIAALESLKGKKVSLLAGGFERNQDWKKLIVYLEDHLDFSVICLPENGRRLFTELQSYKIRNLMSENLEHAVNLAKSLNPDVILLSPGAPSYGSYKNYIERGQHFESIFLHS